MVNVAILGFGVVGSGVAEVLTGTGEGIRRKADDLLALKYILDVRKFPDSPFAPCFVQDFSVIETTPRSRWWWRPSAAWEPPWTSPSGP